MVENMATTGDDATDAGPFVREQTTAIISCLRRE
jgi:hypothetical protein